MDIFVYADWAALKTPTLMGILSVAHTKGREVFSFAYDAAWLKKGEAQGLDPDLQFFEGAQYLPEGKKNFGIFLDSSPDRWGRMLMKRREAIRARLEGKKERTLFEEDHLLGVLDLHRMGAIRFKTEKNGNFLNNDTVHSAPPVTSLKELEFASLQLEKDLKNDRRSLHWLNMLIDPGGSLGGARPKASITGKDGLWIAKFPSLQDATDVGAWEMVVQMLAKKAGVNIAGGDLRKFNSERHTYLSKRFDRTASGERIHFASAMTLLGRTDGEEGASYLDLAAFIMQHGANTDADLEELWRRIVFYIAVKNTDDHLRNHGFIFLPGQGWKLSPAYDVNPNHSGRGLTLNISETDNSLDLDLALSVAVHFRLNKEKADAIIEQVRKAVSAWQKIAAGSAIPKREQELMAGAFE